MIPSRVKQSYFLDKLFVWIGWHLFGIFAGFGFKPRRLLFTLMVLWVACSAIFYVAAQQGVFTPSERAVFEDAKYDACRPPQGNWIACDYPGHPPFSALVYAADNLQPLINFG